MEAHAGKLYHLGIGNTVTRSNLSKTNEHRDCRIFEDEAKAEKAEAKKAKESAAKESAPALNARLRKLLSETSPILLH